MKTISALTTLHLFFILLASCGGNNGSTTTPGVTAPTGSTLISDIQGDGSDSPLAQQPVSIVAIVTGDFQDNDADSANSLGGFYAQQENPDGDAATSDGIFIFDGNNPTTDVAVGDRVEVSGTVKEHFGETQITAASVRVAGSGYIQVTDVELPVANLTRNSTGKDIADLERFEGMLIRFPQALTVTNLRNLERFGEVGLSQGGRLYQFSNGSVPDASGYLTHKRTIAARSVLLDDGLRTVYPATLKYLHAGKHPDYSIRLGDTLNGASGNLRYSRGSGGNGTESWRLMPTQATAFVDDNPRPAAPIAAASVRVAAANVLNFFSKIDSGQSSCGPQGNDNCRGADSAVELDRQLAKTITALAMMDADIVGLVELENNAIESLSVIVDALNDRVAADRYKFVDTGTIHDDAIKTGFIYDATSVSLAGAFALLDGSVDENFDDRRNRPALAQSFEVIATGAVLTIVVNHLKSKGSSCDSSGDSNVSDGQGNCNKTRTAAVAAMANWIATDPTASGDADILIIGDFNAYLMEDPINAFRNAGLTNLLDGKAKPYSFAFDAQTGALDHAFVSSSLLAQVDKTLVWHINADEPALLDYNLENGRDAELFDANLPYRSSDHDPIIVDLELSE